MRAYLKKLALVALAASVSGCPSPELTKRYDAVEFTPERPSPDPSVAMQVFTINVPRAPAATSISSLSDRAQAEVVKALAGRTKGTTDLLQALASPIRPAPRRENVVDRTIVERRVVVSAANQSPYPADRIAETTIEITPGNGAKFRSWDKFVTKYDEIDLGSLSLGQKGTFSATATLAPPQVREVTGVTIGATSERNLSEEIVLKQKIVTSTGSLAPEKAKFYQQGAIGIDLTGNVAIDVELDLSEKINTVDVDSFSNLFDQSGRPNGAEAVEVEFQAVRYPSSACSPITANAVLHYVLRHVRPAESGGRGDQTISEGDDRIVLIRRSTQVVTFDLVPASELRFAAWDLETLEGDKVTVRRPGRMRNELLAISEYRNARDLLRWLLATYPAGSTKTVSVAGYELHSGRGPLDSAGLRRVRVGFAVNNYVSCPR